MRLSAWLSVTTVGSLKLHFAQLPPNPLQTYHAFVHNGSRQGPYAVNAVICNSRPSRCGKPCRLTRQDSSSEMPLLNQH